jgi:mono/diheme cytochrome c family protein
MSKKTTEVIKAEDLMKKLSANVIAAIFFVIAVLWMGTSMGADEKGKSLYIGKCEMCHGPKGNGKGSAATYLSSQPADFTSPKFWATHDEKVISNAIQNGMGEMPAFDFKPDDLKAIIDYITHTFKPQQK